MVVDKRLLFRRLPGAVLATWAFAGAAPVQAHVKWFSRDADCAMPPLAPLQVLANADFLWLAAISFLVMVEVGLIDAALSRRGIRLRAWVLRADRGTARSAALVLRISLALFFAVALWYFDGHGVYLTPELRTTASWVGPLQGLIAATLLLRRTAWIGALGIAVLYGAAVVAYGWFHMLDYPVFLGVAACIALDSIGAPSRFGLIALRVSAGVTLMWAGGEKWLYPWWSDGVLEHELRPLRGALLSTTFMAAAGWIEFCAAFALVFGRLGVQVAAWVLLVPFLAAVPVFGMLDAIGHAPIVVVLIVLGTTRSRLPRGIQRQSPLEMATACALAGIATVGAYWLLQGLAYGRALAQQDVAVALLMIAPVVLWWLRRAGRRGAAPALPRPPRSASVTR